MKASWLLGAFLILAGPQAGQALVMVRMETPLGSFDLELYDETFPVTVQNFLDYVRAGRYQDSFVHRSALNFVIQGGGFRYDPAAGPFVYGQGLQDVARFDPIPNEFDPAFSNVEGTVAMAKIGGDPDSATSQWFINLRDNSSLDTQNGGFTVFGRVVGSGMDVVHAIAALQRWNASGIHPALDTLPMIDFVQGNPIQAQNLVYTSVTELPEPPASALGLAGLLVALGAARVFGRD